MNALMPLELSCAALCVNSRPVGERRPAGRSKPDQRRENHQSLVSETTERCSAPPPFIAAAAAACMYR